jgi:hypothetical protein
MTYLPQILTAVGGLSLLFAFWGLKSEQGRRTFDEMAGMIPLGVGAMGVLLLLVGCVWLLVRARSH